MSSSKYHRLNSFHPFFNYIYKSVTTFWCLSKLFSWQGAYTIVEIFFKCFMNRFENFKKSWNRSYAARVFWRSRTTDTQCSLSDLSAPRRLYIVAIWAGPNTSQARGGKVQLPTQHQRGIFKWMMWLAQRFEHFSLCWVALSVNANLSPSHGRSKETEQIHPVERVDSSMCTVRQTWGPHSNNFIRILN